MNKFKIIAYYLPQFHTFPENDEWWGKGFTEWTNVKNAKPLFPGHEQPKIPADLGYYDLTDPNVREQQVKLAKEAGIYGFCYWHYWFGNGHQLLNEIIDDVISRGKPDFPFCFGWANESWKAKCWNNDGRGDRVLMEQVYGGIPDYEKHFQYALRAFKDKRYIKIGNKPLYVIYKPMLLPDDFTKVWNKLAVNAGFDGIYFVGRLNNREEKNSVLEKGINCCTCERYIHAYRKSSLFMKILLKILNIIMGVTALVPYRYCMKFFTDKKEDLEENFAPALIPNWDHSPRSKRAATILYKSTPALFKKHAIKVLDLVKQKKNKLVFLKSWNEWGEGNYMEPDQKFGKGYIHALRDAINSVDNKN